MLAHQQGAVLNAAGLARNLDVSGNTLAGYLDLLVDVLLLRRLPPFHAHVKKRLVKSPKVHIRDSGLVHALLNIDSLDDLLAHPVLGMSWEGHVLENPLRVAPERTAASFYRTATGVEIDLILKLPGNRLWTIDIKRSAAPKLERGSRQALNDVQPERAFIVYGGEDRYPKAEHVEAIGLRDLAAELAALSRESGPVSIGQPASAPCSTLAGGGPGTPGAGRVHLVAGGNARAGRTHRGFGAGRRRRLKGCPSVNGSSDRPLAAEFRKPLDHRAGSRPIPAKAGMDQAPTLR